MVVAVIPEDLESNTRAIEEPESRGNKRRRA
jgi:hypothetical protein